MISISERIATTRQLAQISAAHLGRLAGLSRSAVAMIESGVRRTPSGETIAKIGHALGVSTDWLLSGRGAAPTARAVKAAVSRAESKSGFAV